MSSFFLHQILTQNGKTGVIFLFLLSGFLIGKLYGTIPNVWSFWLKRYARVFPPLLGMVVSLGCIRFFWEYMNPLVVSVIVLGVAWSFGTLWRKIQRSAAEAPIEKALFFTFFALQIAVALWYVFLLPMTPAPVFYLEWSKWLQMVATVAVNGTMTLPFGVYIGQLDGVYWSLTIEVLFYLLYPILLLPLFRFFALTRNRVLQTLAVIASLISFYGLSLAAHSVLGFHILNIGYFVYFIMGYLVAQWEITRPPSWHFFHRFMQERSLIGASLATIILLGTPVLFTFFPSYSHSAIQMLLALPLAGVLAVTLGKNRFAQFFESKLLVWLGTLSYSIYLTHTIAIEIFTKNGAPTSLLSTLWIAGISAALTLFLSIGLNTYLEKPYFSRGKQANKETSEFLRPNYFQQTFTQWWKSLRTPRFRFHPWYLFVILLVFATLVVWVGQRPPLPLTAFVHAHEETISQDRISLMEESVTVPFTAYQDNLGMILVSLDRRLREETEEEKNQGIPYLVTSILKNTETITTSRHSLLILHDGRNFPIGLPIQADSKGQAYALSLAVDTPIPSVSLWIGEQGITRFYTVYFPNKKELVQNPSALLQLAWNTLSVPFQSPQAQTYWVLMAFFPTLGIATLLAKKLPLKK